MGQFFSVQVILNWVLQPDGHSNNPPQQQAVAVIS